MNLIRATWNQGGAQIEINKSYIFRRSHNSARYFFPSPPSTFQWEVCMHEDVPLNESPLLGERNPQIVCGPVDQQFFPCLELFLKSKIEFSRQLAFWENVEFASAQILQTFQTPLHFYLCLELRQRKEERDLMGFYGEHDNIWYTHLQLCCKC